MFTKFRIDLVAVLHLSRPNATTGQISRRISLLCSRIVATNAIGYLAYAVLVKSGVSNMALRAFPLFGIALTLYALCYPGSVSRTADPPEARRFRSTWKRVALGGIDIDKRTNDIILADTITSYRDEIVDLLGYISGWLWTNSNYRSSVLVISYYPSFARLLQCWTEYRSGRRGKSPFFNAIKYATAFLPILGDITGSLQLWYWGKMINTTFAFVWDVSSDWDLYIFKGPFLERSTTILRDNCTFPTFFYYLAIALDLFFRYIWVSRLLFPPDDDFIALRRFTLESLELLRRTLWITMRVEADSTKLITAQASEKV